MVTKLVNKYLKYVNALQNIYYVQKSANLKSLYKLYNK